MKKKKIRIWMTGIFCVGVLMGGIGTGIALAEFSDFSYQPITAPEEAFQVKKSTYRLEEDGKPVWLRRYLGGKLCVVESREEVPEGEMEINITYNAQMCSVEMTDYLDGEDEWHLYIYPDIKGDFECFMLYKDGFLEGLRQKELRDYQMEYVKHAVIYVNPKDRERIKFD